MTADVAGIRERHAKASREVQAIIDRKWHGEALGAFRMCIPAQLTDSDIVITNSLNDVPELLERLEEVVRQNAALREQLTAATGARTETEWLEAKLYQLTYTPNAAHMPVKQWLQAELEFACLAAQQQEEAT